jgi:hypothetical protein
MSSMLHRSASPVPATQPTFESTALSSAQGPLRAIVVIRIVNVACIDRKAAARIWLIGLYVSAEAISGFFLRMKDFCSAIATLCGAFTTELDLTELWNVDFNSKGVDTRCSPGL